MKIECSNKLVMIGDSITDCGRGKPIGEGLFGAIGNGYVGLVSGLLESTYPERQIRVVNMGNSGDTIRNLDARWKTDVLDLNPDWLSIMIGTNDVWRQFDLPTQKEIHVSIEEYRSTLERLVKNTKPELKGLVLMTPFFMEPNRKDFMRIAMDQYSAVVKDIAEQEHTLFVNTQAAFDEILQNYHPMSIAWDRVHPNITGHMVLARAFLKVMDFVW